MFQNYVWILANPILDFVGRNPRYSRGDLMFLTLDLLPSENMQIYNRGKPKPFPSVCSAHSFSELLTTPVGWLSCCLAPLACVWGDGGRVPAHLVMRDSVPMWGSLSSPTVEEKKGSRKLEVGTATQAGQSSFVGQSTQSQGAGTAVICLRQL